MLKYYSLSSGRIGACTTLHCSIRTETCRKPTPQLTITAEQLKL